MSLLLVTFSGIFAAVFSSYFSVVVNRGFKKSLKGASHCDHCKKPISWYHKVPVLSALWIVIFNKSKTICCGKKFSRTYLFSELLAFAGGVLVGYKLIEISLLPLNQALLGVIFVVTLFMLFLYMAVNDIWKYEIDTLFVIVMAAMVAILSLVNPNLSQYIFGSQPLGTSNLLTAIVGALAVLFLIFASKGKGLGVGDVFIVSFIGFCFGSWGTATALFFGVNIAALAGIAYSLYLKKFRGVIIPLVPFLFLGWLIQLAFFTGTSPFYGILVP